MDIPGQCRGTEVEGVGKNRGGLVRVKPCHECLWASGMCPSPPPASCLDPSLPGGGGQGVSMPGQPSLITVVCPCPPRTPLEQDRVSLWDSGPLSCHPGPWSLWGPGLGHRDCPASPGLLGSRLPPRPRPRGAIVVSDEGPACRGSGSFQGGGLQPEPPSTGWASEGRFCHFADIPVSSCPLLRTVWQERGF